MFRADPVDTGTLLERVDGRIEFTEPVPVDTIVVRGRSGVRIYRLDGMMLEHVEFTNKYFGGAVVIVLHGGFRKPIHYQTITEAVGLLLFPSVQDAIASGKAKFSNTGLEDFVAGVLITAQEVAERGYHKVVKLTDLFRRPILYDKWRYIVDVDGDDGKIIISLDSNLGRYYFTAIGWEVSTVEIGYKHKAKWRVSYDTASILLQKFIDEFPRVKTAADLTAEFLKLAYIGVKSYVS